MGHSLAQPEDRVPEPSLEAPKSIKELGRGASRGGTWEGGVKWPELTFQRTFLPTPTAQSGDSSRRPLGRGWRQQQGLQGGWSGNLLRLLTLSLGLVPVPLLLQLTRRLREEGWTPGSGLREDTEPRGG